MNKKTISAITTIALMLVSIAIIAQPSPGKEFINGGEGSNPVGGGAPLGGGLLILLSLTLGYTIRRIYEMRKKALE